MEAGATQYRANNAQNTDVNLQGVDGHAYLSALVQRNGRFALASRFIRVRGPRFVVVAVAGCHV